MKFVLGFFFLILSTFAIAQRNGSLRVVLATDYFYEDYFKITNLRTKEVLVDDTDYFAPKRNFQDSVIVEHKLGITDTFFVQLKHRRNYEYLTLDLSQTFLDSIALIEKDREQRLAKIQYCPGGILMNAPTFDVAKDRGEFDEEAKYPGGWQAAQHELATNIHYPEEALELSVSGKVYLQFSLNEEGLIECAKILRGIPECYECGKEALKALIYLKPFEPAKNDGKPVRSYYTLPINFSTQ